MMKRALILLLLVGIVLVLSAGFTHKYKMTQSPKLNIKDLPEHSLIIVSPSNTSFDDMVTPLSQSSQRSVIEAIKPYSVFLKNQSDHTIVACLLKWEMMQPNGIVKVESRGFITLWRLMKHDAPDSGQGVIKPHSSWFFSPSGIEINQNVDSLSGTAENKLTASQEAIQADYLGKLTDKLAEFTSITVTIDGVFYEDGSFVGPNTLHLFETVDAQLNARRDLSREVASGIAQGKHAGEIFKEIEELAHQPKIILKATSQPSDFYHYYKKDMAEEILGVKQRTGGTQALEFVTQSLHEPFVELKKVK